MRQWRFRGGFLKDRLWVRRRVIRLTVRVGMLLFRGLLVPDLHLSHEQLALGMQLRGLS